MITLNHDDHACDHDDRGDHDDHNMCMMITSMVTVIQVTLLNFLILTVSFLMTGMKLLKFFKKNWSKSLAQPNCLLRASPSMI